MYTREILEMPEKFVRNCKPVFGTFKGHPHRLDIRGVFKPFGTLPFPVFITNLRIKSRLNFTFDTGDFFGRIKFFDAKIFGYSDVVIWNKKTSQKYCYHAVMGPRIRFVPHDLDQATTSCFRKKRYTRISWDRKRGNLSVIFNLKGDSIRPDARGALRADFTSEQFADITTVRPAPTMRRCSASYCSVIPMTGSVSFIHKNSGEKSFNVENGQCFFNINRTYMKFRSHGQFLVLLGEHKGKKIAVKLATSVQDSVDSEKYNANFLFYDGKVTPLPPVVITHSYGIDKSWVIQDTENMVDLVFTPSSVNTKKISAFILRTVYDAIFGSFEGTLYTADNEKISFKSMAGMAERYLIRL